MKVCHITSVHKWNDTRIFHKECCSLVKNGIDVFLVVPAEKSQNINGVEIIAVATSKSGRFYRATITAYKVYRTALKTKSIIYHFHDPELFWVGILLKLRGKRVIFDIHENIREQINEKKWLKFRGIISKLYWLVDIISAKLFYLILAEKSYETIYSTLTSDYQTVMNFPDTSALSRFYIEERGKNSNGIFYVGGISFERGFDVTIEALSILAAHGVDFHFHCVGSVSDDLRNWFENHKSHEFLVNKITFYGAKDIFEAFEISRQCKVGLSILKPIKNYINSYSTKIFEYMAVGLPVITSNFPLYRDVIEQHSCGKCIDPLNVQELADSLIEIFNDSYKSSVFGKNGYEASLNLYSWRAEEEKLLKFYDKILNS